MPANLVHRRIAARELELGCAQRVPAVTGDAWVGAAAEAFIVAASSVRGELTGLAGRWNAEASALSTDARGVQDIKDRQRVLEIRREETTEDLRGYEHSTRTADREVATAMAVTIELPWQTLVADRDAINRACIAVPAGPDILGAVAPGSLGALRTGDALLRGRSATDLLVLARTDPDLGAAVTDHAVSTDEGTGYLDPGTESLRTHTLPAGDHRSIRCLLAEAEAEA